MPTGELRANGACAPGCPCSRFRATPRRWEWGWFRRAFVHAPAVIIRQARSAVVRLHASYRYTPDLLVAAQRRRSLQFR
jgi:hypothetical protein